MLSLTVNKEAYGDDLQGTGRREAGNKACDVAAVVRQACLRGGIRVTIPDTAIARTERQGRPASA